MMPRRTPTPNADGDEASKLCLLFIACLFSPGCAMLLLCWLQTFKFMHKNAAGRTTELKAPKSKQLYQSVGNGTLDIGTCWLYEVSGAVAWQLL